jgi:hypothetical protein
MPPTAKDKIEIPLTFEKGLVTEVEDSTLDLGQAATLLNWEPAANGVLRARNAWASLSKTGLPATYAVRGFGAIAVGAGGASVVAPTVVQTEKWPDANEDAVATKALTLTGCTIGNVLVAVASDDSGLTPTVTAGWTQRAIATGANQYVRFYTKTASSSTEGFTYTITQTRLRALTLYELQDVDAEDPGAKWGADTQLAGGPGSSSVSVTAVDADGGIAIVGYLYDGGTPDTSDSGTAGMTSTVLDNANTRTAVFFEDLDLLDAQREGVGTIVTASWTPPSTGTVIVIVNSTFTTSVGHAVSGNGLTWNDSGAMSSGALYQTTLFWADCSIVTPTTGAITITISGTPGAGSTHIAQFIRGVGCPTSGVVVQKAFLFGSTAGTKSADLAAAGQVGSGILGSAMFGAASAQESHFVPQTDVGDWESATPFDTATDPSDSAAGGPIWCKAVKNVAFGQTPDWTVTNGGAYNYQLSVWEIAGNGASAQSRHGTFTNLGSVTEAFSYVANKRITEKMVVWGYTPRVAGGVANQVDFYIVVAIAVGATTYQIYRLLRDDITTGTWELIDTVTDATSTDPVVAFAQGAGRLSWTSTSLTVPRTVLLDPITPSNISDLLGFAGRAAAYHKDRLFISGSNANPSRVFFSDIGLPTSFVTATDYLDIGGDDGEAVQDTISVEGLLLVCKVNRLYLISGSGIESFFVNELPGGSAAGGRPAIRTPYGTIVAGADDIWVVQGGGVDPMSRPLGSGYGITGNVSTAYGQDTVLVADSATGKVWRVNLVTGAWGLESVSGVGIDPIYLLFSLNGRLYYGTGNSTQQLGGKRQLSDARSYDATAGGTEFEAATGKIALQGPTHKYTPLHVFLQLRNHDPAHPNAIHVTVATNMGEETVPKMVTKDVQRERIDVGKFKGAEWIQVRYVADSSASAGAIDVEKGVLNAIVEQVA